MIRKILICICLILVVGLVKAQDYNYLNTLAQTTSPGRLVVDDAGAVFVTLSTEQQVLKMKVSDGTTLAELGQQGMAGKSPELLNNPSDVTLDEAGNIYIADKGNKRVIKYDAGFNYIWEIDLATKAPESVTVGPDGKLYICYSGDGVGLLVYNQTTMQQTITTLSSDKFRNPLKVRFDNADQLYIVDRNTGIIKVSSMSGSQAQVAKIIKKEDGANVIVKCEDLVFSSKGSMIVSSSQDKASENLYQGLYRFSMEGIFVDRIGLTGAITTNDGFTAPVGITIDQHDHIYVADAGNTRIQIWEAIDNQAPEVNSFNLQRVTVSELTFSFALNEKSTLYGLIKEEGQPQPDVSELLNPALDAIAFNVIYNEANTITSYTKSNLPEGKNYVLYYVARDESGNTTSVNVSDAFSTIARVKYLIIEQKETTQVSLNVNSTLAGQVYYCLEDYTGQTPAYTTHQQVTEAANVVSFNYTTAADEALFTVSDLLGDSPYRISLFVENGAGLKTPVTHYIFRSKDDLDLIYQRYKTWCVGDDAVDYTNPLILARYEAMLAAAVSATENLHLYDVTNPGESYDLVGNSDHINHIKTLVRNTLFPLAMIYHIPGSGDQPNPYYQNPKTRDQVLGLFRYLSARGFVNGCNSEFKGGGVYLGLTSYFYASMLMKKELEKAELLDEVSANMAWWTRWDLIGLATQPWSYEQKSALKQADFVRTFYNNHMIALLTSPDSDLDKADKMALLADVYNEACEISYGWGGFIKPDFTGYHHHGIWGSAYITEALHMSSVMSMLTRETAYAYSASAIDNISQAMLAYRFYCNKYDNPKSISGRFPTNQGDLLLNTPAFAYLQILDNGSHKEDMGAAFKRLWTAPSSLLEAKLATDVSASIQFRGGLGGLQQLIALSNEVANPEPSLAGNQVFPYGNMQVHRRDEWMASVKGYSKYVWDFENNGEQNWFGRNQSAGALEIFATHDPATGGISSSASGWHEAGYDWDHVPGTTTFDLPNWTDHDKDYIWAKFSPEYFVGGVSQSNGNGVFAMKYVDVRETGWVQRDYKLKASKSYFFFDDQIVCLGSDIKSVHPSYQVHSTLFQNYLSDISMSSSINGIAEVGATLNYVHPDNSSAYLTDVTGNSYFLRDASQLNVTRQLQSSRDNRDKKDTEGNFVKAWIDHADAANANYEYLVWVQAPDGSMAALAANPDEWYLVEQKDEVAHVVTHVKKKMTGYAIFQADQIIDKGVVYSTDNDCVLMHEDTEQGITLSVAHPDLGWLDKSLSLYQVWNVKDHNRWLKPVEQAVEITLKGQWQMSGAHPSISHLGYDSTNDQTRIQFRCLDGKSLEVNLEKGVSTGVNKIAEAKRFSIFPNPSHGEFSVRLEEAVQRLEIINTKGSTIAVYEDLQAGIHPFSCLREKGTYLVRISGRMISETQKLVVL